MKKHLLAAAVAAAIAVPAAAQVTVYGAIGYTVETNDTTSAATTATPGANGLGTPVLGFKGSEDLGGGMKASFQLEGSLRTPDGSVGSTANSNQLFDRQSWVGVSGGFGDIRMGRTATATKDIEGYGDVGANLFDVGAPVDSFTDRFGTTVRYESPKFMGANIVVTNTQGKDATAASAEAGVEVNAYVLNYSAGPLKLGVGKAESKTAAGFNASNTLVGASYNLGVATVELGYQTEKPDANGTDKLTQIGATIPLGSNIDVRVNYSNLDIAGATSTDIKYVGAMGVYSLSKRTRAFVGFRDASYGSGGSASDSQLTVAGVIHSF
jgi:predicted porin